MKLTPQRRGRELTHASYSVGRFAENYQGLIYKEIVLVDGRRDDPMQRESLQGWRERVFAELKDRSNCSVGR